MEAPLLGHGCGYGYGYGYSRPPLLPSLFALSTEIERDSRRGSMVRRRPAARTRCCIAFPEFLPPAVDQIKDRSARAIASRIQRFPVQTSLSDKPVTTACVPPRKTSSDLYPVLLLHGFDSSCLEWRYTYPLLEAADLEVWALDILGWGFSDVGDEIDDDDLENLDSLSTFDVSAKREHLFEFWRSHIKTPMTLVGASLGGAIAIDFCIAHPEAVSKLILVNAQGYAEGTGKMASFPKSLAYAGVSLLKSVPLRLYANFIAFNNVELSWALDAMNIGRLHCLMPRWEDASVDFMLSGGYDVASLVPQIAAETLVIWGRDDKILGEHFPQRFEQDLRNGKLVYVDDCGHLPHVEKPESVALLINEFARS